MMIQNWGSIDKKIYELNEEIKTNRQILDEWDTA